MKYAVKIKGAESLLKRIEKAERRLEDARQLIHGASIDAEVEVRKAHEADEPEGEEPIFSDICIKTQKGTLTEITIDGKKMENVLSVVYRHDGGHLPLVTLEVLAENVMIGGQARVEKDSLCTDAIGTEVQFLDDTLIHKVGSHFRAKSRGRILSDKEIEAWKQVMRMAFGGGEDREDEEK